MLGAFVTYHLNDALFHTGVAFALVLVLFRIVESRAAMRGQQGTPLPAFVDKSMRLAFLFALLGPLALYLDASHLPLPLALPLLALYAVSYVDQSEQNGGYDEPLGAREWRVWALVRRYFSLKMVKTADLDPKKAYVIGMHPHGILPFASMIALGSSYDGSFKDLFPGLEFRTLCATFCYLVPGYRDMLLRSGFADAARYSAHRILSTGKSIALVPGGATEALYADPDKDVLYLKKRHGFIRMAIQHGAPLVPFFGFNECRTYAQFSADNKPVQWLKTRFQRMFGISLPLIKNIIPRRTPVTCVIGAPIEVPHEASPSKETVQKYLDIYIEAVKKLHAEHSPKYSEPADKELVII